MDEARQKVWLVAEHSALGGETTVLALGPAIQDKRLAAPLVNAAMLRKTADDLFQAFVQRVSTEAPKALRLH